jgi:glutamate-1-semialdehyde 2,1-aminomutase
MSAHYTTIRSARAYAVAQEVIPGGVNSGARGPQAGWIPGPPMVARGQGARLWDIDGNEYIDHLLALGPLIHGHAHPEIADAVARVIREMGTMFALPYELEAEAARRVIAAVPSVELVRFGNSGTEVVLHAMRLARAWTGRDVVIRFEGQYHGWADQLEWSHHPDMAAAGSRERPHAVPGTPGIPSVIGQTLAVLPWNDIGVVERLLDEQGDRIAAILTEPIMGNTGVIPPEPGYLQALRDLATTHGIVLIFDEVITGFRVALGGAQAYYGVTPDLTTMAKALGGGYPVAAVGGRRDIMDQLSDGHVLHAGTYNANSVAIAAAIASLDVLARAGTYDRLFSRSERLMDGIGTILASAGVPAQVQGVGPMFQFWFSETPVRDYRDAARHLDSPAYAALARALHERGVMIHPSNIELWFVSTAHEEADVDRVLEAFEDAVRATLPVLQGEAEG